MTWHAGGRKHDAWCAQAPSHELEHGRHLLARHVKLLDDLVDAEGRRPASLLCVFEGEVFDVCRKLYRVVVAVGDS